MIKYNTYTAQDYNQGVVPSLYVTTPVASFNHTCCAHSPTNSDLPIKVLHRCETSGTLGVVLRGCISFNPLYREYSRYNPYLLNPRARVIPSTWRQEQLLLRYQTYLLWLADLVRAFPIIQYVELLNEYHFIGACYLPHNKALLRDIMRYWHSFVRPLALPVKWGVSEPLIGQPDKLGHIAKVNQWRHRLGLDYTGLQLHMKADVVPLTEPSLPYEQLAITENYSTVAVRGKYQYVCDR